MSNALTRPVDSRPADMLPPPERPRNAAFSKAGRQIAQSNSQAELQAVEDHNQGRVMLHRIGVNAAVAKAEATARRELVEHAMRNARLVDDAVIYHSGGRVALEMNLRDFQAAHHAGEIAQIIQRGYGV